MVSLPDFNLNKREEIKDVNFINRATKGVSMNLVLFLKHLLLLQELHEGLIET